MSHTAHIEKLLFPGKVLLWPEEKLVDADWEAGGFVETVEREFDVVVDVSTDGTIYYLDSLAVGPGDRLVKIEDQNVMIR